MTSNNKSRLAHLEQFPAPRVVSSEKRVNVRGFGIIYGSFEISNGSEGDLVGSIDSMADFLSFSPQEFEANRVQVEYTLDLTGLAGDIVTAAVITTNGGEKVVDFHITVDPPDVLVKDGVVMGSLADFAAYAKMQPIAARALFGRQEFMMWLLNIGYPNMDIYEKFAADPNKERAVDNF
ncbi:MAG: DUF5717 family protein, partial [Defluviitaleaceae bacterium]|nr:DUF5717 family protein [Defluviitaleaceae bacterium]